MVLPVKGKDIIAVCSNGEEHYVFRCACKKENCTEWRCSITGAAVMIDIIGWRYDK